MTDRRLFLVGVSSLFIAGSFFAPFLAFAQKTKIFADEKTGVAMNGYDPVAYFVENAPVKGNGENSYEWSGAIWHFSSAKNKEIFAAAPEKYAPQYGGYCAFAVSRGYSAPTIPEAFTIVDDKLYLNFSLKIQKRWRKDIEENIIKADKNWPDVLK